MNLPNDKESFFSFMKRNTGANADPYCVAKLYSEHADRKIKHWHSMYHKPVFDSYFWDAINQRWRKPVECG